MSKQIEVMNMAREAGLLYHIPFSSDSQVAVALHRFAKLVRADEREALKDQPAQKEPVAWAEFDFRAQEFTGRTATTLSEVESVGLQCEWVPQMCIPTTPQAQPQQEPDLSEQGRTRSAILGNNVEAMMDAGLPFLTALETTLKVYDHDTPKIGCVNHDCDKCEALAEQPAQQSAERGEPVAWLDGPHLVMRSDWRDRANYKGPWVDMGRAIPDSWVPALYTTPQAQPRGEATLAREPLTDEPEIVQRVKWYAGQTLRTARNPNITARECIELANWLAAHGINTKGNT